MVGRSLLGGDCQDTVTRCHKEIPSVLQRNHWNAGSCQYISKVRQNGQQVQVGSKDVEISLQMRNICELADLPPDFTKENWFWKPQANKKRPHHWNLVP